MVEHKLTIGENTYVVDTTDESINDADNARLIKQDELISDNVDLLPAGFVPKEWCSVLDVACGPGGWIRRFYARYPRTVITGIDNNVKVINYARKRDETKESDNVSFELMNIMEPLKFEDDTFDFVNARFLTGVVPKDHWVPLLKEYLRVLKPGGYVRLTEAELSIIVDAPATWQATDLLCQAMWHVQRSFAEHTISITPLLKRFLRQAGFESIDLKMVMLDWSADEPLHEPVAEDMVMSLQVLRGLLTGSGKITNHELDDLIVRVHEEISRDDYYALWPLVSVQAQKPA